MIRQRNNFACQEFDLSSCHPPCSHMRGSQCIHFCKARAVPIEDDPLSLVEYQTVPHVSGSVNQSWCEDHLGRLSSDFSSNVFGWHHTTGGSPCQGGGWCHATIGQRSAYVSWGHWECAGRLYFNQVQKLESEVEVFPYQSDTACLQQERKGRCSWFAQEDLHTFAKQGLRTLVMGRTGHPKKDGGTFFEAKNWMLKTNQPILQEIHPGAWVPTMDGGLLTSSDLYAGPELVTGVIL